LLVLEKQVVKLDVKRSMLNHSHGGQFYRWAPFDL
jgi:hypothetical protein